MGRTVSEVQVQLAADGFYPRIFRWAGRSVRVLSVEGLRTCGAERWFRLRTLEGRFELSEDTRARVWRVRRSPNWFARTLAQVARAPRYSLPVGSSRGARGTAGRRAGRAEARRTSVWSAR